MSEEEKKAYDNLIMLKHFTTEKEDKDSIDIILKLIDKQQKEIEEIKEKNITLEGNKIGQQLAINELQHSIEEQARNSISKDKIRKLIKDINEETQYLGKDRGETKQQYAVRKIIELLGE